MLHWLIASKIIVTTIIVSFSLSYFKIGIIISFGLPSVFYLICTILL